MPSPFRAGDRVRTASGDVAHTIKVTPGPTSRVTLLCGPSYRRGWLFSTAGDPREFRDCKRCQAVVEKLGDAYPPRLPATPAPYLDTCLGEHIRVLRRYVGGGQAVVCAICGEGLDEPLSRAADFRGAAG